MRPMRPTRAKETDGTPRLPTGRLPTVSVPRLVARLRAAIRGQGAHHRRGTPVRRRRGPAFRRAFLSHAALFSLPVILLGAFSYQIAVESALGRAQSTYLAALEEVRRTADSKVESLISLGSQLANLDSVKRFSNRALGTPANDRYDPIAILSLMADLTVYRSVSGLGGDIALCFSLGRQVVSTLGYYDLDSFFGDAVKLSARATAAWKDRLSAANFGVMLPREADGTRGPRQDSFVFVHTVAFSSTAEPVATMLFFLDDSWTIGLRQSPVALAGGKVYVVDPSGSIIAHTGTNEEIAKLNPLEPADLDPIDGPRESGDYLWFSAPSRLKDWVYVGAVPRTTVLGGLGQIKVATAVMLAVSLVLGAALSFLVAARSYRPIDKILSLVRPMKPTTGGARSDEFAVIEDCLTESLDHEIRARHLLDTSRPLVAELLLTRLLRGYLGGGDVPGAYLAENGIHFPYGRYAVIVAKLPPQGGASSAGDVQDVSTELAAEHCSAYLLAPEVDEVVVVVNFDTAVQVPERMESVKALLDRRGLRFRAVGCGRTCECLRDLHRSFDEALHALDYRMALGDGCVVTFDETCLDDDWSLLPPLQEEQILRALRAGDPERATALCRRYTDANLVGRRVPSDTIRLVFSGMARMGAQVLDEIGMGADLRTDVSRLRLLESIEEMEEFIVALYAGVAREIEQRREGHDGRLRTRVIEYIDENVASDQLSLKQVAAAFGVSVSYLSRFIKQATGTGYLRYVNERRMRIAEGRLRDGHRIGEVARSLGFHNETTFRRQFKKYLGLTPMEYRDTAV